MDGYHPTLNDPAAIRPFPLILTLDTHGVPHRWISWQHACYYYAKDQVAWSMGNPAFTVHGGMNRITGERSMISGASIIAIKRALPGEQGRATGSAQAHRARLRVVVAAVGDLDDACAGARLTRDHIVPFSRGGRDTWMNVVTACRACNERKSDRTPEGAGMELVYLPYVPNRAEYLILTNRRILADQMEFLAQHVPAQSRLHQPR